MDNNIWIGKKVFIKTQSDRIYTGIVLDVTYLGKDIHNADCSIFTIKDKFEKIVAISNKEIKIIDEENE